MYRVASRALVALLAAVVALGACSSKEKKREEQAAEEAIEAARFEPVDKVLNIEIGRTRNGYVVSVVGLAPGLGYGAPELRPRREGNVGPDGFLDYDFIVQAPDPKLNLGQGEVSARRVQMGLQVKAEDLRGATGIRVHAVTGGLQMAF